MVLHVRQKRENATRKTNRWEIHTRATVHSKPRTFSGTSPAAVSIPSPAHRTGRYHRAARTRLRNSAHTIAVAAATFSDSEPCRPGGNGGMKSFRFTSAAACGEIPPSFASHDDDAPRQRAPPGKGRLLREKYRKQPPRARPPPPAPNREDRTLPIPGKGLPSWPAPPWDCSSPPNRANKTPCQSRTSPLSG